MKKILLTLTALFVSTLTFAQTNTFPTTGNVGIGTTSPKDKLHIGSTLGATFHDGGHKALTWNGYYSSGSWKYIGADFTAQLHMDNGSNIFKINVAPVGTADGAITWTNALSIKDNGLVGIGTPSPNDLFHVSKASANTRLRIGNNAAYDQLVYFNGFVDWSMGIDESNSNAFTIASTSSLDNSQRFVLDNSGNVGIGTTTPTEKLEVNGTIRSKKVKVEATGWPDYVFSENYKLRTLNELEQYIQANKHLPEVPSAAAIETNGLDLGSMDAALLKKVEELTLYTIAQEKQIKKQAQENDELWIMLLELKKEIEQLKKDK